MRFCLTSPVYVVQYEQLRQNTYLLNSAPPPSAKIQVGLRFRTVYSVFTGRIFGYIEPNRLCASSVSSPAASPLAHRHRAFCVACVCVLTVAVCIRLRWQCRGLVRRGASEYGANRKQKKKKKKKNSKAEQKRAQRKARVKASPAELSCSDLCCSICNRQLRARIGLISYLRTHKQ